MASFLKSLTTVLTTYIKNPFVAYWPWTIAVPATLAVLPIYCNDWNYAFGHGYGNIMVLNGVLTYFMHSKGAFPGGMKKMQIFHLAVNIIYGLRLKYFIAKREADRDYKRNRHDKEMKVDPPLPRFAMAAMVASSASMLIAPVYYHATSVAVPTIASAVGAVLMVGGLLFESIADEQQNTEKKKNPKDVVMNGLWRYSRSANYTGEIIFHIGNWLTAVHVYRGWTFATSAIGPLIFVQIMIDAANRRENERQKKHGNKAYYQQYVRTTSRLFPGIY